jgi:hypothetical protein
MRTRQPVLFALMAMLLAGTPAVHAASKEAAKLEKLLKKDKLDKVLEVCAEQVAAGLNDPEIREVCAQAGLIALSREHGADNIPRTALDEHRKAWEGTRAGDKTLYRAAELALLEAGDDPAKRRLVYSDYSGTETAETVIQGFWETSAAERSIAAARSFQEEFTGTAQAQQAELLIQELAFEATSVVDTSSAWQTLFEDYPEHEKTDEIQGRWMSAVWRDVEAIDSQSAWKELLESHPEHPRVEEATARRIDAIWRDSQAQGPTGLLAFINAYPSDPRAAEAWRRVFEELVQVTLANDQDQAVPLTLEHEGTPGVWIDKDFRLFEISLPVPAVEVIARIETHYGGVLTTAQDAWLPLLVDNGLPEWRVPATGLEIEWSAPDLQSYSGQLSRPLCRPDQPNSGWTLVLEITGGVILRYPFQVRERCAGIVRSARSDVPITLHGRKIRLGWSAEEVALVFPFQEPAPAPFSSDRIVRTCLPSSGGDAVCFDFYDQLLVGLDVACWSNEPCFEGQGTYNRVVPDLRRPLRQVDVTDTDDGARVTLYRSKHVGAVERQYVDLETGTPNFHFSIVDTRFLAWVRPQAPAYVLAVVVE